MSCLLCVWGCAARCPTAHSAGHYVAVDVAGRAVTVFENWGLDTLPTDVEIREAFESTPPVTP